MSQILFSPSIPDLSESKAFLNEKSGNFRLMYFKNIHSISQRIGGRSLINYPYVLALFNVTNGDLVYLVTAESGVLGTSCLCAFDSTGNHLNFGSWDVDATPEKFVAESKKIILSRFEFPEPIVKVHSNALKFAPYALVAIATYFIVKFII